MDVSVVVPTYRRPALLRRCLDALAAQDLDADRFEVVVVDDASEDGTAEVLARPPLPVVALTQPRNAGPAAARNRGLHTATGRLVVFLDDDVAVAPDLLAAHLSVHADAGDPTLAVLGRVDWSPDVRRTAFLDWLDRSGLQFAYDTWLREGAVDPPYAAFYTANLSLDRTFLVESGGFDERFPYPAFEDLELAYRLTGRGLQLRYVPQARAFHTRSIDLRTFRARMRNVGRSRELLRAAAPGFPVDDEALTTHLVGRRRLLALRLGALTGNRAHRDAYYWAAVAAAYHRGRQDGT